MIIELSAAGEFLDRKLDAKQRPSELEGSDKNMNGFDIGRNGCVRFGVQMDGVSQQFRERGNELDIRDAAIGKGVLETGFLDVNVPTRVEIAKFGIEDAARLRDAQGLLSHRRGGGAGDFIPVLDDHLSVL